MSRPGILCSKGWRGIARIPAVAAVGAMLLSQVAAPLSYAQGSNDNNTTTPIKHVILIIGENRTFDNVFGTYKPRAITSAWDAAMATMDLMNFCHQTLPPETICQVYNHARPGSDASKSRI